MFLQVRPSGPSHEEAHLKQTGRAPTKQRSEKFLKRTEKLNAGSRPVSWLNCPRAEWRECVPAKACCFAPYWNPVPPGPLFGERRSEGCLLQQEDKIKDGEEEGEIFFWFEKDTYEKKDKKKKIEWMICMYGAWCFGDISRTADTLVLYKLSEVSMCALWMSEIGPPAPRREDFLEKKWIDGLIDGGWSGAGSNVAVDWVGFWGSLSVCDPRRQDGGSCLSVWHPDRGRGSPKLLRPWVCTLGPKVPLPLVTVWQELFGVFGAATKCAMCYVAWFIIFLQATKLICSPIV